MTGAVSNCPILVNTLGSDWSGTGRIYITGMGGVAHAGLYWETSKVVSNGFYQAGHERIICRPTSWHTSVYIVCNSRIYWQLPLWESTCRNSLSPWKYEAGRISPRSVKAIQLAVWLSQPNSQWQTFTNSTILYLRQETYQSNFRRPLLLLEHIETVVFPRWGHPNFPLVWCLIPSEG